MAEVIGIAASGLALAEVAGKIITASLAVKRLLADVKELPESFALLLDQVAVLTPVLAEVSCDAVGSSAAPTALDRTLNAAAAQCGKALEQLQALASELSEQIEQSRGFRRRLAAVKIVLRKDHILKLEKRLNSAVQLLSIAQQTCILWALPLDTLFALVLILTATRSLQRMQPGLLVSLIVNELEARNQVHSHSLTYQKPAAGYRRPEITAIGQTRAASARNTRRGDAEALIRLGLPEVTGLIEIQVPFRTQTKRQPSDADSARRQTLPVWTEDTASILAFFQNCGLDRVPESLRMDA
jgi:hypothetical protein